MQNKKAGFTLVEVIVSAFLLSVILAALFLTLSTGQLSSSVGLKKVDLQAHVRQVSDLIARDVRQTFRWEIAAETNAPSGTHIKFRQVQGWDPSGTGEPVMSANYIDYNYDEAASTITRSIVDASANILNSRVFSNIIAPPFYTVDPSDGSIVALDPVILLASGRMVIDIRSQAQIRGALTINFTLKEEVKIRNE